MRFQFTAKDFYYIAFIVVAALLVLIQRDEYNDLLINGYKGLGLALMLLIGGLVLRLIFAMSELSKTER